MATPTPKLVHLIGIGGIGMSAIAEILYKKNSIYESCIVQGSDTQQNDITKRVESMGIKIFTQHDASNITSAVQLIIISSAISNENPEVKKGLELNIPIIKRGAMLAELMTGRNCVVISGTHGKTTTTSLIGHLLESAKLSPTIINGGIMRNYGSNVFISSSESAESDMTDNQNWFVVEGDESDGTMLSLPRRIIVLTNIGLDHMEYYKTEENLKLKFIEFIHDTISQKNGLAILCIDCPKVTGIWTYLKEQKLTSNVITYGLRKEMDPDVYGYNIRLASDKKGMIFDVQFLRSTNTNKSPLVWKNIFLPLHGLHNVQNSLASLGIAKYFQIAELTAKESLVTFLGTERRFKITGQVNGITIIDDYAHHPTEIRTTIMAAKELISTSANGKLIVIHQPHRFSRLKLLYQEYVTCFSVADRLILTPIYTAGESPITNIDSTRLATDINNQMENVKKSYKFATSVESFAEAMSMAKNLCQSEDVIFCCGAGNITQLAHQLPDYLNSNLIHNS